MLLPIEMREWIDADDPVHLLIDGLAVVDLSGAAVNERGSGSAQYPPAMMLGLLIYCYSHGVMSSRDIERATHQNIAVRYLTGNTHPDHDTISEFRRRNGPLVASAFVEFLRLAKECQLVKVGTMALDGTRMEANASKRKTTSLERLDGEVHAIEARVQALLALAEQRDRESESVPAEKLPKELIDAQKRRAKLLAAKAAIEAQTRQRHEEVERQRREGPKGMRMENAPAQPSAQTQVNSSDPESRLIPSPKGGFIQGYNAQIVVDAESPRGLILAADVVAETNDMRQLEPMIRQATVNLQQSPHVVLADTGYDNYQQAANLEAALGCEVLVPLARTPPLKAPATPTRDKWKAARQAWRAGKKKRFAEESAQLLYQRRGCTVEPIFGTLKAALGFKRFLTRGLENVRTEWTLACLAFNFSRMARGTM